MIEFAYTLKNDPRKAFEEIEQKMRSAGIEPTLAILFLTESLQKRYDKFKFNFDTVSVPVEGFITPDGVWTRGCLCMFTDIECSIGVFRGKASEVVEKLRSTRKGKFNMLIYPIFYVESMFSFISGALRLKLTTDIDKASRIYEEIIYPMNTILRPFRDDGSKAVALNIFPLNIGIGKPQIAVNGRKLGRGIVNLSFNRDFKVRYTDFLPERGGSLEETKEILKQEFQYIDEVFVEKKGIAISSINGMKVKDFLRKYNIMMKENLERDIEKGRFFGATPYGILFISRQNFGSSYLGLMDYDVKFYPSLFDLDVFFSEAVFVGEVLKGGISRVINELESTSFVVLDQNIMLMFEDQIVKVVDKTQSFGVISSHPSYTGLLKKNCMSEVEDGIFTNATLSTLSLNF
ncbi:hypothetical protein [Archaeoglobus neptunius]|uniref:hypothetical protein n=1 Tax=Archaeoglobus neptunius TaxID=2798580 RepID=UPI00192845A5|nr:hypothetical protein [Archaeoglobus neptunius]